MKPKRSDYFNLYFIGACNDKETSEERLFQAVLYPTVFEEPQDYNF